jgi:hypothetical protein
MELQSQISSHIVKTTLEKLRTITDDAVVRQNKGEKYPVNLDDAWGLLGYSTKGNAVQALKRISNAIEGAYFIFFWYSNSFR